MRAVVQKVSRASVAVAGETLGSIDMGLLVFLGIAPDDTEEDLKYLVKKVTQLRIFEDAQDKMNLALADVGGSLLLISQFTLYADLRRGNRPGFTEAGDPARAEELYEYIVRECSREVPDVQKGRFGADMKVALINDGPFTILLDSSVFDTPRRG